MGEFHSLLRQHMASHTHTHTTNASPAPMCGLKAVWSNHRLAPACSGASAGHIQLGSGEGSGEGLGGFRANGGSGHLQF